MSFLLYGSYGYTGRLIAQAAVARGHRPVLAGRNSTQLERQAGELALEYRTLSLDNPGELDGALRDLPAVLHCAGPFSRTSGPMAEGCLRTGRHYLDITGEVPVFEALAARDGEAKRAGVMLLPGVGFDVVSSDCLAMHLKQRLPSATSLTLAFRALGRPSRGTATTMIEHLGHAGLIRQGGKLISVPAGSTIRTVDFGSGPVTCVRIPWGDLATAYRSTGIPNIETYAALASSMRRTLRFTSLSGRLLTLAPLQRILKWMVRRGPAGPSESERLRGSSLLWGEVRDGAGGRATSRLSGPEAYSWTAATAVAAMEKVLAGSAVPGFQTPALAFGPEFVLGTGPVLREDLL